MVMQCYTHACMHIVHMCTHTYARTHACMHARTHTHTHTHTHHHHHHHSIFCFFLFQIMGVCDLTGRLVKGDLDDPQKVVDYVIFERHLLPEKSNLTSSRWHICAKLLPQLLWELVKKKALQDKQNSTVTPSAVASS